MELPMIHRAMMADADWPIDAHRPFDPVWFHEPFEVLREPVTGQSLVQATTVRVVTTVSTLWVRYDCADADAWATMRQHDEPIYTEEVVELFIGYGDLRPTQYYELQVNPLNTRFDGIITNPDEIRATMHLDTSWDPPWQSWVHRDASGWSAVMAVPWATLGRGDGSGTWRLNFMRIDRNRDTAESELSAWSPTLRVPADFHIPSRFGIMVVK